MVSEKAESRRWFTAQFGGYIIASVALFTVVLAVVEFLELSPLWAYVAGFAVSMPVEMLRDWFQDIQNEVSEA